MECYQGYYQVRKHQFFVYQAYFYFFTFGSTVTQISKRFKYCMCSLGFASESLSTVIHFFLIVFLNQYIESIIDRQSFVLVCLVDSLIWLKHLLVLQQKDSHYNHIGFCFLYSQKLFLFIDDIIDVIACSMQN